MGSKAGCNLKHVVFEVTEHCNNACAHCYNFWREGAFRGRSDASMSRARFRVLLAGILRDAPVSQIAFSGGEPLFCPELPEIVCDATDAGLNSVVITNATLLSPSLAVRFPEGTIFEITLFSPDAGVHNAMAGRRAFGQVLRAAAHLLRSGHRLAVACVVTRRNFRDIAGVIDLAVAIGADAVLVNRMNLTRRSLPMAQDLVPAASELREALDQAESRAKLYGIVVSVSVPVPPCVVDPGAFKHLHFGFCPRGGAESYYTISWDGRVRPCNHASVILGNLDQNGFGEIVRGHRAEEFWGIPIPRECRSCRHPLRHACRGGCPAAALECTGRRGQLDPFVGFAKQP